MDYHNECPNAVPDTEPLVDLSKGEVRSDTGQMYRNWKKCYGTVDTPMTKVFYGNPQSSGPVSLTGLQFNGKNTYTVLALSSLNNEQDIEHSDSLLLTAVGDVTNTDMKISQAPDSVQKWDGYPPYMQLDDFGKPPILCEVIEAEIAIRTEQKNMLVWAVNAEGIFVGNVPVKYEDGWLRFALGKKYPSIYYLIQAE